MTTIVVLAILGIVLVLIELVIPGGILGIGGIVCLVTSVVMTFVNYGAVPGAIMSALVLIFGIIMLGLWMKHFHHLPFTKNLVLRQAIDDETEELRLRELVGKKGVSLTRIAPSGHAEINGEKIDVMTEVGVIEKGKSITVIETRGPSIFVEAV